MDEKSRSVDVHRCINKHMYTIYIHMKTQFKNVFVIRPTTVRLKGEVRLASYSAGLAMDVCAVSDRCLQHPDRYPLPPSLLKTRVDCEGGGERPLPRHSPRRLSAECDECVCDSHPSPSTSRLIPSPRSPTNTVFEQCLLVCVFFFNLFLLVVELK